MNMTEKRWNNFPSLVDGLKALLAVLWLLSPAADAVQPLRPYSSPSGQRRAPSHVLVKFRKGPARAIAAIAAAGLNRKREISRLGVQVVDLPAGQTAEEAVAELQKRFGADLEYAEPDRIVTMVKIPDDPLYGSQYHLAKIGCPAAWDSTTGSGVTIAIADTGVMSTHPDLAGHLLTGFNVLDSGTDVTDNIGHGTAVAGAAAAIGDNALGVAGVAYNATILPIKISNDGFASDSDIAEAIIYAANHEAKVVNVSFGSNDPAPAGCWGDTVINAAAYMRSRRGLVIMSAGNAGINKGCSNIPEIINVSAVDSSDVIAYFSNYGAEIDVSAPGVGIWMTNCSGCSDGHYAGKGNYVSENGTSFAAPIAAGVLGLIYAIDATFTADQAQQILFDSTYDLGTPGYDIYYGWGRVNAQNAISLAQQRSILFQEERLSNVYAYPNPWDARKMADQKVTIENVPDDATIKIFTLSGFWVTDLQPSNGRAVWQPLTNHAGERVASGVYFYYVKTSKNKVTGEIAIIR
jgi:thermitase